VIDDAALWAIWRLRPSRVDFGVGRLISGEWSPAEREVCKTGGQLSEVKTATQRARPFLLILLALALSVRPMPAQSAQAVAGFETATIAGAGVPPIDIAIWYPSVSPASDHKLGGWVQRVAAAGALARARHALIVVSHGGGGWYGGHYDTALSLARGGFIVAAPTHPGDNFHDQSGAADMAARPRDLKRLVDYMLGDWHGRSHVDRNRIGVFGFSNGGFTALVAIGGVPDFARFGPHCKLHPDFEDCRILARSGISLRDLPERFPPARWAHDPRIKAAVIAAPALGFLFSAGGLDKVGVPVQLWRAADDHVLPQPEYAEAVRHALPHAPEYHVVANAGHYDFLAPCDGALAVDIPSVCRSNSGFDRIVFHKKFNAAVVSFFERALEAGPPMH